MKIKKITDRVELNVSAQGLFKSCSSDCTYWKTYSKQGNETLGDSWCKKVTDARWSKWW